MLRRRIVVPALPSTALQFAEVSKRYTQYSEAFHECSPTHSNGLYSPKLRGLHKSILLNTEITPKTTTLPTTKTMKRTKGELTRLSVLSFLDTVKLNAILKSSEVAGRFTTTTAANYTPSSSTNTPKDVVMRRMGVLPSMASQSGLLRTTAVRLMPVLAGPTLDTRIGDIMKIDNSLAAEMLPNVVRLLIDPQAEGVENVSLSDFAAMQPKRQLAALGGKKIWHDWLIDSTHYKQVARLGLESPYYDLRALQQAGISTLYQWAEQPDLVKVSSYTRSLLDAAVEKSVEAYVVEVAKVVNKSILLEDTLISWAADTIGKFVLDTLRISMEQATAQRDASGINGTSSSSTTTSTSSSSSSSSTVSMTGMNENGMDQPAIAAMNSNASPNIRPGEVCTLEHYHRLARKVLASVRKEYIAQRQADQGNNNATKIQLDSQAEAEIREKAYTTLSDAMLRVLEAQSPNMPQELHSLRDYGFLALERLPGLLRQASSVLQLQSIPVRYFVFHSTGEREEDELERQEFELFPYNNTSGATTTTSGGGNGSSNINSNNSSGGATLNVTAPALVSGIFLAGTGNCNITLGEWPGFPQPPPSSLGGGGGGGGSGGNTNDPLQNEYFSVLHRLKRHTTRVARTSIFETIKRADDFRNGFNAVEALGLHQLLGTAKLVEDRLISVLNCYYNSSSISKPIHFIEAGHSGGKSSMLQRLSKRMNESGRNTVTVRYSGTATPFTPGLDDHPLAFPARFWFRVALSSCPYLVRTEELFTRAPKSVMWWANRLNWSWEQYQKCIRLPNQKEGEPSSLHAILVDDIDRVLDAMENRFVHATFSVNGILNGANNVHPLPSYSNITGDETHEVGTTSTNTGHNHEKRYHDKKILGNNSSPSLLTSMTQYKPYVPFHPDMVEAALARITVAVGQLDMVFTGHRVSKMFLTHADTPVRRYFIPLANGIGLQQRLRVLPLISVLYALHQRSRLEFSGLMYEVLKNCPGLLGYTLEVFWSGRAALMDLRGGAPRLMQWSNTHPLFRSNVPTELFAELPQRNFLLQNLPEARLRLVELLQRQLSSPTGYLTTGVDTTLQDERDGLIVPYNNTTCQVHPFALFTIFTHQDPLESPKEATVVRAWGEVWAEYCAVVNTMGTSNERKRDALRVLLHGALLLRVVAVSGAQMDLNLKIPPYGFPLLASPTRIKQKGGAEPLVTKATPETVRKALAAYKTFFAQTEQTHFPFRPSVGLNGGCDVVSIAGTTLALYDLVTTPEALKDISYRFAEALLGVLHCLGKNVLPQNRIRQIHYVSVVSIDQSISFTSTNGGGCGIGVCGGGSSGNVMNAVSGVGSSSSMATDDVFASPPTSVVPYFLDLSAVFEDDVIDRLRALQDVLGISKEFRTLNDLLDELESAHHVYVHQDVVASSQELESLLSTTLTQLVPDATVLPAYAAELVSPDALLLDLLEAGEAEMLEAERAERGERGGGGGAEAEEMRREAALAREAGGGGVAVCADAEHLQESAEMLEALLNDALADPVHRSAEEQRTHDTAQEALLADIAAEDAINNSIPVPDTNISKAHYEDALAWLHDIITPPAAEQQGNRGDDNVIVTTTLSGAVPQQTTNGGAFVSLSNDEDEEEQEHEQAPNLKEKEVVKEVHASGGGSERKKAAESNKKKTTTTTTTSSNSNSRNSRPSSRQQRSKPQRGKAKKQSVSTSTGRKKASSAATTMNTSSSNSNAKRKAAAAKKNSKKSSTSSTVTTGKKNKRR
ncbi:uncharacterized protein TM35_000251920 [Trypanosoma theileri]|uniref:Uncharacterized protein n=1 Tax=Trypanosoma theileri TaxID=67003 RepID=A0A1X0NQ95_9TRYP|nr:uncharacterized protein TM35_000251920 [Trypanosoma theileri]ORC86896.1 hypothetical protein TM35_000251920 [Trypanosoma theileri]